MGGTPAPGKARLLAAAVVAAVLVPCSAAGATTIVPDTTSDVVANDGKCSLREAITAARTHLPSGSMPGECPAGSGKDVISLGPGDYVLSIPGAKEDENASGDLDVGSDLTIRGAGASSTTIETTVADRVIEILAGVTATIEGVTITGGHPPAGAAGESVSGLPNSDGSPGEPGEGGGGILNKGTLTVTASTVIGNTTGEGGAGGNGTAAPNPGGNGGGSVGGEGGRGGGIDNTGVLAVLDSAIINNTTGAGGVGGAGKGSSGGTGGAGGFGIGGNGGGGGWGGGIASVGALTVTDSTISGNTTGNGARGGGGFGAAGETGTGPFGGQGIGGVAGTGGFGGGIYARAKLTVTESSISGNKTGSGGFGGIGTGGSGGSGTGTGTGGAGGQGDGGFGGEGGDGAGISTFETTGEVARSAVVGNVTGDGGPGNAGVGGAGGAGGSGGGNGGEGGVGQGGAGGSGGAGAGVELDGTEAQLVDSTVASNIAGSGNAGGDGDGGSAGLGRGGGLEGVGGNAVGGGGGDGGSAAGVFVDFDVTAALVQDTISDNAPGAGGAPGNTLAGKPGGVPDAGRPGDEGFAGGVFAQTKSTTSLADSIVAGNAREGCTGTIADAGHNISFPDATCPGTVADPKLGPLQGNGGPTPTEAIAAGSPAVDGVPASGAGCQPTDQRGVLRPAGAGCDIGAFELATATATTGSASGVTGVSATLAGLARNPDIAGASASFQYGTTTAYGRQTVALPIGAVNPATAFSARASGLTEGVTYHYRAVVTNAAGTSFGADQTFITPRAVPSPPPERPPVISGLTIHPSSLLPDKGRGASIARAKSKRGATVTYRDSRAAVTTFTVQRAQPGFLVGRSCSAKKPRHGRIRHCTRYVSVGAFSRSDAVGANRFQFTGRVKRRALSRGRYRLLAVPVAAGLRGKTVSVAFSVL